MSPFAALGLDEEADERAVKRAYALRLRTTRPDEDAEGFQALNSAYKAALAAIRWRAEAEAAAPAEPVPAVTERPEPEPPRSAGPLPLVVEPKSEPFVAPPPPLAPVPEPEVPAAPPPPLIPASEPEAPQIIEPPEALFDYASATDNGAISFDFDAFAHDLFAVMADAQADLRAWLQARMASWPIAMKPTLAPHVLAALDDEDVAISPDHFKTIITAFGLDDVLSGIDPLAVEQLRAANARRYAKWEAVERARRLLAPGNRRALDKAVRVGGYPPFVAAMLARLVTGRGAAYRTELRWLPLVARAVGNLLRYVSANNVDALSPPIPPKVLARWRFADRTIGRLNIGHWIALPVVAFFLAGIVAGIWEADTRDVFAKAFQEERSDPDRAVRDYTDFINSAPQPWSDDTAANVAIALFNRGLVLSRQDRIDEAMQSYKDLDGLFANYGDPRIRLQVARGLLNLSYLSIQKGDYLTAIGYARKVAARYSGANDEQLGENGFDLQVVKALNDQADASNRLGGRAAALIICRSVLDRFKGATGDAMKRALEVTRTIENEALTGANSPPNSPPPETFVPSTPSDTPRQMPTVGVPKNLMQ